MEEEGDMGNDKRWYGLWAGENRAARLSGDREFGWAVPYLAQLLQRGLLDAALFEVDARRRNHIVNDVLINGADRRIRHLDEMESAVAGGYLTRRRRWKELRRRCVGRSSVGR